MHRCISVIDLLRHKRSRKAIYESDFMEFYNILHEIGFDINKSIEEQNVWHRALHCNKPVLGVRWIGVERTDEEWMSSEYCTRENKMKELGKKDPSLVRELEKMSEIPKFTDRFMEFLSGETESGFKLRATSENTYED